MQRRVLVLFGLVAVVGLLMIGCGDEKTATAPKVSVDRTTVGDTVYPQGYGSSWPNYSQWYRNQLLFNTGFDYRGQYGGQCKVWVQDLVARVTDNRVKVPTNVCNGCSNRHLWNTDPYGHIRPLSADIRNVPLGYAVQMSWGSTKLHTFIMGYKSSSGFYMLDSNWNLDGRVGYHFVSYSYFNSLPNLRYTVYVIGW